MTRTWLVTGANRGIGFELTRQALVAGEAVIATARDPVRAEALRALGASHPLLTIEAVEMGDFDAIDALGARLEGRAIDILVNNAGLYGGSWDGSAHRQSLDGMEFDLWAEIMRVNVMAPFQMVRALLPHLNRGTGRLVVNMSSDLGSIANNTLGQSHAYRTSKAALNMLT